MTALFLGISVIFNTIASLLMKKGAGPIMEEQGFNSAKGFLAHVMPAVNIYTFLGIALLGISFATFMVVLSRVELSIAQPMLAMTYAITAVAAYFIFGEALTAAKISGIAIIIFGIFILSGGFSILTK